MEGQIKRTTRIMWVSTYFQTLRIICNFGKRDTATQVYTINIELYLKKNPCG